MMCNVIKINTISEEETIRLGEAIGTMLKPLDIVLMVGKLGTGKTRIAKGMISKTTGVPQDEVVSPTFTIINRYEGAFPVYHVDLYRIEADQLDGLGLEDSLEEGGVLIIEWAEKIAQMTQDSLMIYVDFGEEENSRNIIIRWSNDQLWETRVIGIMKPFQNKE